jgi:hypothetical protein
MNIWGKMGKEYYTWYIENMDQLEEFIINNDIDVDRVVSHHSYRSHRTHRYTLTRQLLLLWQRNDTKTVTLASRSNTRYLPFTIIKAVVF